MLRVDSLLLSLLESKDEPEDGLSVEPPLELKSPNWRVFFDTSDLDGKNESRVAAECEFDRSFVLANFLFTRGATTEARLFLFIYRY